MFTRKEEKDFEGEEVMMMALLSVDKAVICGLQHRAKMSGS